MGKFTGFMVLLAGIAWGMSCSSKVSSPASPAAPTNTPTFTATLVPTIVCSIPSQAGNSSTSGTSFAGIQASTTYLMASQVTLSGYAGVQSLSVYLQSATGLVEAALYSDNGGAPQSLLFTPQPATAVNGWNTILVPATYLYPGTYWIAFQVQNSTSVVYASGGSLAYASSTWGTFPAVYPGSASTASNSFAAYVNYCGLQAPTPTNTATNSSTSTSTNTATLTATNSNTGTPTNTATKTNTGTPTNTATNTATSTNTGTPTNSPTITNTPTPGPDVIDTMEQDGSSGHQVIVQQGRNGYWNDFTDNKGLGTSVSPVTTGNFVMSSPGYNSSYCARITGTVGTPSGGNYPYAGMIVQYLYPSGPYNITASTAYTGIAFMMKATFSGACITPEVAVKLDDATTNPSGDANRVEVTVPSGVWTPVTIFFDQMLTQAYAVSQTHAFDPTTAHSIAWLVSYSGSTYDVSVDNLQFITAAQPATLAPLGSATWAPGLLFDGNGGYAPTINFNQGRGGYWYTYWNSGAGDTICPSPGTSFQLTSINSNPDPGDPSLNPYAAAISGTMGTGGYPGMGFKFLPSSGGFSQTYDIQASAGGPYTGVQFYAMSGTGPTSIYVDIGDASTDPGISGATCTTYCNQNHATNIGITGSWVLYQVPFTSMTNGSGIPLDPTTATSLNWGAKIAGAYNFMVDNVSFY